MSNEINGLPPSLAAKLHEAGRQKTAGVREEPPSRPAGRGGPNTPAGDSVSLTETAARLQVLENRLKDDPGVDSKRVEALRQAIADGSYRVDPQRVADRLLAFEQALGLRTPR
jgi:negative regulator of flagellin synthesis FlgM